MRIAILTEVFHPKIDGITNRLRHTLRCLREEGHDVLVVAPDTAVERYEGFPILRVPSAPFPPYPEVRMSAPDPRILAALRRFAPDVVHAVGPVLMGLWGMLAARLLALPIVASYHTDLPRYAALHGMSWAEGIAWPLIRGIHGMAHVNLTPSSYTRRELQDHGIENVGIWRGGVDTERFHPSRRCERMRFRLAGGVPEAPLLVYAGRIAPEKQLSQVEVALRAVPDAQLALVGDGPARAELEARLPEDRVTFTGFLHGEELATALASADVFFMPSTTETLGFVVLEAMASGVPVVAAAAGGIPDLVRHAQNGWLYDPGRPEEAARGLQELLGTPSGRSYYGDRARKHAERCTWPAETLGLVDHYRRAIAIAGQSGVGTRLRRRLAAALSPQPA